VDAPIRRGIVPGDGLLLSYCEWGTRQPDVPPLVLLHGLTGSGEDWSRVAVRLAAQRRVIALDARGHGASAWSPEAAYASDAHFADVATALDALGVGRCVLAGYSMGGGVAILTAGALPERVTHLVVVDAYPAPQMTPGSLHIAELVAKGPNPPAPFPAREGGANAHDPPNAHDAVDKTSKTLSIHGPAHSHSPFPGRALRGVRRGDPADFEGGWGVRSWPERPRFDPAIARRIAEELASGDARRLDLWPLWEALRCPTLVVRGGYSDVLPAELAAEMLARQPRARLATVSGVGHQIPFAAPAALAGLLAGFIDQAFAPPDANCHRPEGA
jgi:esterase